MKSRVSLAFATLVASLFMLVGCGVQPSLSPVAELETAAIGKAHLRLSARNPHSWRDAVIAANTALGQSLASKAWSHGRVRLKFADGGWIEFQPAAGAIAVDALPPLRAIQFGRAAAASRD